MALGCHWFGAGYAPVASFGWRGLDDHHVGSQRLDLVGRCRAVGRDNGGRRGREEADVSGSDAVPTDRGPGDLGGRGVDRLRPRARSRGWRGRHPIDGLGHRYRIERGAAPEISRDGRWVVAAITPTLEEREKAEDDKDKKKARTRTKTNRRRAVHRRLANGEETRIDEVESFALSDDGRWLAYKMYEAKDEDAEDQTEGEKKSRPKVRSAEPDEEDEKKDEELGTVLTLRELATGERDRHRVRGGLRLCRERVDSGGEYFGAGWRGQRGSPLRPAGRGAAVRELHSVIRGRYTEMIWAKDVDFLAFVAAVDDEDGEPGDAEVFVWTGEGEARRVASKEDAPEVSPCRRPTSSRGAGMAGGSSSGSSRFRTRTRKRTRIGSGTGRGSSFDPYDVDADPRGSRGRCLALERSPDHPQPEGAVGGAREGPGLPRGGASRGRPGRPAGRSRDARGRAHRQSAVRPRGLRSSLSEGLTWAGRFADLYAVDLKTGERRLAARRFAGGWGPRRFALTRRRLGPLLQAGDWHLFDTAAGTARNLTADSAVPSPTRTGTTPRIRRATATRSGWPTPPR